MKKILVLISFFLGYVVPAFGCSYWIPWGEYEIRDGQVYYRHDYNSEPMVVEGSEINLMG